MWKRTSKRSSEQSICRREAPLSLLVSRVACDEFVARGVYAK